MRQAALLAALAVFNAPVQAANLAPSDHDVTAAIKAGRKLAATHGGYPMKDHIAWAVPDSRNIDPTLGDVDAVLVATPLERATQAGFFAAATGNATNLESLRESKDLKAGWLNITLFTHGPDEKDESYVTRFSTAELVFPNRMVIASETEHSDPSDATYPLASERRKRQIATITFRFDLHAFPSLQAARAQLQFSDDLGKRFDIPIDLGSYR